MIRTTFAASALLLGACATTEPVSEPVSGTTAASPTAVVSSGKERISSPGSRYSAPVWYSDSFSGEGTRTLDGQTLVLEMEQTAKDGGIDTAVAFEPPNMVKPDVSEVHPEHYVCFRYDVDLETDGKWWAGPKISVNWIDDPDNYHGMSGWYENYIVETASQTPDELVADLTGDYFKGLYLGTTEHDGGTYRHYRIAFMDWTQFYAVRDSWRNEGSTSIGPILAKWSENGLTDETYDGSKINIETYGPTSGRVEIEGWIPDDSTVAPSQPPSPDCYRRRG